MSSNQPQVPQPDPALKKLEPLVGTRELKGHLTDSNNENISGRTTFQWLPGGFFLQQDIELNFMGMPIKSHELIGFDPENQKLASLVYSNMSPVALPYTWDVEGDRLTITVNYGRLDATFTGSISGKFGGAWKPNPGADPNVNVAYELSGKRMNSNINQRMSEGRSMSSATNKSSVETFLQAGVLVGPLFVGLSLVLALASPAFDLTKHEVSLLLVGNLGWLQMINFIATGLLGILCAIGLRRALKPGRASLWGPITLGAYGVLLILASLFHPDPQLGFPSGAPAGIPLSPTTHNNLHSLAFSLLALAIVANGFILARRYFVAQGPWALYGIVNSVVILVLAVLGGVLTPSGHGGLPLLGVAIAISVWVSAVALRTLLDSRAVSTQDTGRVRGV